MRLPRMRPGWWFFPPVLIGAAVLAMFVLNRGEPQRAAEEEVPRLLRVIEAPVTRIVPRALGYGTAEPGRVWQAVAEVRGRIVEVHPDLEAGAILQESAVALQIDPSEYDLAIAQLEAGIRESEAKLEELETRQANDQALLEIEQDSLEVAESQLRRLRDLLARDATAESEVEQQQRTTLTQRQKVQMLLNTLKLYPTEQRSLEANIAVQEAQLQQARNDRAKTTLRAPFDSRIGPVQLEVGQYVTAGQTLFEAQGTDLVEVEAHVAPRHLRNLLQPADRAGPITLDMETMRSIFDLDATVRFQHGEDWVAWPARFTRVRETLDPATRTLGVVFAIDDPYASAVPGQRPPPVKGTFCEVEMRSRRTVERVIVPRAALHGGHVYVVDGEGRLRRRPVEVAFVQSGFAAIAAGLEAGETVVVSDPTPAIEGMLVTGVADEELVRQLSTSAGGEGSVR